MTPLLLPHLLNCASRQLAQMARCAALRLPASSGLRRCFATVTMVTAQVQRSANPAVGMCSRIGVPLLGQCHQLCCVQPASGFKTKTSLKRRCKDCFFVWRRGRLYVYCKTHPRHKQRQG